MSASPVSAPHWHADCSPGAICFADPCLMHGHARGVHLVCWACGTSWSDQEAVAEWRRTHPGDGWLVEPFIIGGIA